MVTAQRVRYLASLIAVFATCSHTLAQRVEPRDDRIDAIVDRSLVVPVTVKDPSRTPSEIPVRLDDAQTINATLVALAPAPVTRIRGDSWTRTPDRLVVIPERRWSEIAPDAPRVAWLLMIDLPLDAVGQGIWIDGERYEPNWLPAPQRVMLEVASRDHGDFWKPALDAQTLSAPMVRRALEQLRANPIQRWRAELMEIGLEPTRSQRTTPRDTERELDAVLAELETDRATETLDRIGDHIRARWQLILGRTWLVDPGLARRLRARLCATVDTPSGPVPVWIDDERALRALAHDLLSPYVNDELRVRRLRLWLDSLPTLAAWITDDTGVPDPSGVLTPTVSVLTIEDAGAAITTARIETRRAETEMFQIDAPALAARSIAIRTPRLFAHETVSTHEPLSVTIGRERRVLNALATMPLASPPGAQIGPLVNDWTLEALVSAKPALGALPPARDRTVGILTRVAPLSSDDPRAGWRVYLETPTPEPELGSREGVTLKLWIGPRGAARAVYTFSSQLGLTEARVDERVTGDPVVTSTHDGKLWRLSVDLPPEAIDESLVLTLGIERSHAGHHSAYPRRMTPWDTEPARAVFDISSWSGEKSP